MERTISLENFKEADVMLSDTGKQAVRTYYNKATNTFIFLLAKVSVIEAISLKNEDGEFATYLGIATTIKDDEIIVNDEGLRGQTNFNFDECIKKDRIDDFNFKTYITTVFKNEVGELSILDTRDSYNHQMVLKVSFITTTGERHTRIVSRTSQQVQAF